MNLSVSTEIMKLNQAVKRYQDLSGKNWEEALSKQGGKLAFSLSGGLKEIAPPKGLVRSERLAALKTGGGVKIRQRVRTAIFTKYGARSDIRTRRVIFGKKGVTSLTRNGGKRLNLQALMVQRELATRESGRGFLSVSARYPRTLGKQHTAKSKFGQVLSSANLKAANRNASLVFEWGATGALSQSAAQGLSKDRGQSVIARSLAAVTEDILIFVDRKVAEQTGRVGLT
jgi:hypothetical protein